MTTFPDDIMRAAREAYITAAGPQMDRASAERIRAGAVDGSHATTIIATAIMAERQRCVDWLEKTAFLEWEQGELRAQRALENVRRCILSGDDT